jgi:hypothetical protein
MNVKCLLFCACLAAAGYAKSQSLAINTDGSVAHPSAILDVSSTNKGILPPRLTRAEIDAIPFPGTGLTLYNKTDSCLSYYNGTTWINIQPKIPIIQVFTITAIGDSTFTWIRPSNLSYAVVEVCGGGGAGGGCNTNAGGSGAGGGYSRKILPADSFAGIETIRIGKGGRGGEGFIDGEDGGTTSFGTHFYATGGQGGKTQYLGLNNTEGSYGGSGNGGDFNIVGGPGGGTIEGGQPVYWGGSSFLGGGAPARMRNAGQDGISAIGYGGGGSGASGGTASGGSNKKGGDGASGVVILTLYLY